MQNDWRINCDSQCPVHSQRWRRCCDGCLQWVNEYLEKNILHVNFNLMMMIVTENSRNKYKKYSCPWLTCLKRQLRACVELWPTLILLTSRPYHLSCTIWVYSISPPHKTMETGKTEERKATNLLKIKMVMYVAKHKPYWN